MRSSRATLILDGSCPAPTVRRCHACESVNKVHHHPALAAVCHGNVAKVLHISFAHDVSKGEGQVHGRLCTIGTAALPSANTQPANASEPLQQPMLMLMLIRPLEALLRQSQLDCARAGACYVPLSQSSDVAQSHTMQLSVCRQHAATTAVLLHSLTKQVCGGSIRSPDCQNCGQCSLGAVEAPTLCFSARRLARLDRIPSACVPMPTALAAAPAVHSYG
eukprot:jgi/Ulvmu1/3922/UM018_0145.1